MAAGGSDALAWTGSRSGNGAAARAWLAAKGNSIEGGTSEIQLNIVANRILELPPRLIMRMLRSPEQSCLPDRLAPSFRTRPPSSLAGATRRRGSGRL